MASGWVKSLQCKSRAADDVVHHHLLPSSTSCRNFQSLKDVIETTKRKPKRKSKLPPPAPARPSGSRKPESVYGPTARIRPSTSTRPPCVSEPFFPALTELPEGHPSRNVVEIIFHTSWSTKPFPGRVDMVFKVQNMARTVARFDEYREMVKSLAGFENGVAVDGGCEDHSRCLADGNEVMRFYCLGPVAGGPNYECSSVWSFHGRKGAISTFSGSGGAHENAGGGRGRRAMLVCRVIAGRVCKQLGLESECRVGFNSVSGENGELVVFDTRALLPCFLIIYKV